jgi:hypothetical protein
MVIRKIPLKSKHIRWNCEKSEENFHMDIPLTRYYFAIVDKRLAYRKDISSKIVNQMTQSNSWLIPIGKEVDFKVKNSEWGLLFVCYDALVNPESLNFSKLGIISKRDYNLCKKKVLNIEDYLTRIYE